MSSTPTADPTAPSTVWLARGRHLGSDAADVLRGNLERLKESATLDDFQEPTSETGDAPERIFEARWRVADEVTVRARLSLSPVASGGQEWVLAAEAEQPWDLRWPSPATMFWPDSGDVFWDRDAATGLRLRDLSVLPEEDKDVRRVLRQAVRGSWAVHVVVHEAMTTDQRGRRPLADMLPPSLRHRVVEHRAQPHQLRVLNWAVKEFGVEVPRGGAVVLPGTPVPPGYDGRDFSVRSVFLDGSEPTELIATVTRYAAMPKPLPEGGEAAVTALREQWQLLTLQEELERERALVTMYAEALEAMTKSRDLYREAAERANEALAIYRENAPAPQPRTDPETTSPLQQLTKTFGRWKDGLRPAARDEDQDRQIS
ncbi:hypothetical protein M2164_000979 [Streptomyces sp. SAI-208]|jgi:hypothetical protein|uniref:hypothetical protein n=1 Tax=unclassified Streptomyces TaxID=2593676 RepID=UPI00247416F4|nr:MULTISPECIES: hypothetical protein [unclassified Streptomyces]MDH6514501.1 hypothetical protein [Streptomyces sp. SAI-090]MDH6565785.1 hypothetical protein [Streptomyces sp. SAI-117]MDH6605344.1 hypothetical protein [Streptomyces sp. SAI-208]